MVLPASYPTKEDVPEALREHYKEVDGKWIPDFGSHDPAAAHKKKVDEFREANIAGRKKIEELTGLLKPFEGLSAEDLTEAQQAIASIRDGEEKDLLKAGKLDEVIQRRTVALRDESDRQIKAKTTVIGEKDTEIGSLRSKLTKMQIDAGVQREFENLKVRLVAGALEDAQGRTRRVFSIDEKGEVVAKAGNFGKDAEPLTMAEHASKLITDAPHLFEAGKGTDAPGNKKPPVTTDGKKNVDFSDPEAFQNNLEDIAKGKAVDANTT